MQLNSYNTSVIAVRIYDEEYADSKKSVNGIYFETFGEIKRILQLFEGGKSKQIAM